MPGCAFAAAVQASPATLFVNVAVETLVEGRSGERLSNLAELSRESPPAQSFSRSANELLSATSLAFGGWWPTFANGGSASRSTTPAQATPACWSSPRSSRSSSRSIGCSSMVSTSVPHVVRWSSPCSPSEHTSTPGSSPRGSRPRRSCRRCSVWESSSGRGGTSGGRSWSRLRRMPPAWCRLHRTGSASSVRSPSRLGPGATPACQRERQRVASSHLSPCTRGAAASAHQRSDGGAVRTRSVHDPGGHGRAAADRDAGGRCLHLRGG